MSPATSLNRNNSRPHQRIQLNAAPSTAWQRDRRGLKYVRAVESPLSRRVRLPPSRLMSTRIPFPFAFILFVINVDGTGLEQVTFNETFDGFPMFSPDGRKLVFASNRNAAVRGDTNVFIADWVE